MSRVNHINVVCRGVRLKNKDWILSIKNFSLLKMQLPTGIL